MSSLEPRDVGPLVGGDLAATALDRARAIDILRHAHAAGRLPSAELEARVALAQRADIIDDLVPLTRGFDLTTPPHPSAAPLGSAATAGGPSSPQRLPAVVTAGADPRPENLIGFLGGTTRSGTWRVRHETNAYCLMGGHTLDLREATFDADEVVINVQALMGGVDIKVPAGVRVIDEVVGIMGGTEIKGVDAAPHGPVIRLKGLCIMAGVSVKGPATGRRSKRHRKARGDL